MTVAQTLDRQLQELRNILKRSPVPSVSGSAPSEEEEPATGSKDLNKLLTQVREEQAKILKSQGQGQPQASRRSSGDLSSQLAAAGPGPNLPIGPDLVTANLELPGRAFPKEPPPRKWNPGPSEAAAQTDLLEIRTPPVNPSAEGPIACWTRADDEAQTEALRRIELLRSRGPAKSAAKEDLKTLEDRLDVERRLRQDAEKQLAQERMKREATQQQVMCLEYELDGKETQLQEAERQLEQREVQHPMEQSIVIGSEDVMRGLRTELEDKDRQLELKENEIKHLLSVLNQHGSTAYAEDRLSSTYSAYPTMGFR